LIYLFLAGFAFFGKIIEYLGVFDLTGRRLVVFNPMFVLLDFLENGFSTFGVVPEFGI
jgi:hypothetical protein